jgi:hypothetical protein
MHSILCNNFLSPEGNQNNRQVVLYGISLSYIACNFHRAVKTRG